MLLGTNLKIRPLEKEDFDLFYEWMQTQDCLGNFMDMQMIYKERFLETLENSLKKPERFYAIIENNDGKPIGEINSIQILGSNTTVEIGMFIAETASRGRGLGTESLRLFVNYLFETNHLMRIQYKTRIDNVGMKAVGEKLGFQIEGILKKYRFDAGEYRDYYLLAITRDEWEQKFMFSAT